MTHYKNYVHTSRCNTMYRSITKKWLSMLTSWWHSVVVMSRLSAMAVYPSLPVYPVLAPLCGLIDCSVGKPEPKLPSLTDGFANDLSWRSKTQNLNLTGGKRLKAMAISRAQQVAPCGTPGSRHQDPMKSDRKSDRIPWTSVGRPAPSPPFLPETRPSHNAADVRLHVTCDAFSVPWASSE